MDSLEVSTDSHSGYVATVLQVLKSSMPKPADETAHATVMTRIDDSITALNGNPSGDGAGLAVLNSRFGMGASDDMFLQSGVQLLYSGLTLDKEVDLFPEELSKAVTNASREGMLHSMDSWVSKRLKLADEEMRSLLKAVSTMLSWGVTKDVHIPRQSVRGLGSDAFQTKGYTKTILPPSDTASRILFDELLDLLQVNDGTTISNIDIENILLLAFDNLVKSRDTTPGAFDREDWNQKIRLFSDIIYLGSKMSASVKENDCPFLGAQGATKIGEFIEVFWRLRQLKKEQLETTDPPPDSNELYALTGQQWNAANNRVTPLIHEVYDQIMCEMDAIITTKRQMGYNRQKRPRADLERNVDTSARKRRGALWNDAMRHLAISQDRLWSFVRQVSGVIGESVEGAVEIDDPDLSADQKQSKRVRSKLVEEAVKFQTSLAKSLIDALLKDSSLRFNASNGIDGALSVIDSNVRDAVRDLASGNSGVPFFSGNVALESLTRNGGNEMSLKEIVDQLRNIGEQVQEHALRMNTTSDAGNGSRASLEYLAAPRNSLMIRPKNELFAALRTSFDRFRVEARSHGLRHIYAYELIEGKDSMLCNAFAEVVARTMAHSRLFGGSSAQYVGFTPAKLNAQMLSTAIKKLILRAKEYTRSVASPPNFKAPKGREQYFEYDMPLITSSVPIVTGFRLPSGHARGWGVWPMQSIGPRG